MNKTQFSAFSNELNNITGKIKNDQFKGLEAGECYLNTTNRPLLYRVEYLNALGQFTAFYDILKPAESITKTNPVNKVKIYI